jgi:DNA mismatch repair protein MutL
MPRIQPLPEHLVNKIAAGEVIERPASVVKELIENCIDAKASKIMVEVKDFGTALIRISDNGKGMDKEDARMSIIRHATSKISSLADLFAIQSLGFRGEALASIAAVSNLTITTKEKDNIEGYEIFVSGGKVERERVIGAQDGTTIEVKDLFFNTPARKKFLKTELIELKHIIEVVTKYALHNPNISFTLINEERTIINAPKTMHGRSNLAAIYGTTIAKTLLEVAHYDSINKISVRGFVSKPLSARNDKSQQTLFVNNRFVRNKDINQAIYDAYHSLLFHGKHPAYVLSVNLDPKTIDVNVHPAKTEVKIEQRDLIYKIVYDAVHSTLKKNDLIPDLGEIKTEQIGLNVPRQSGIKNEGDKNKEKPKYQFEASKQVVFETEKTGYNHPSSQKECISKLKEEPISRTASETMDSDNITSLETKKENGNINETAIETKVTGERIMETPRFDISGREGLPPMKILGQIHKTFFVAETPGGLLLIDQHVVEERVNYEKFMEQYLNKSVSVQNLLEKELISFTTDNTLVVKDNLVLLKKLGFELEHFEGNDFRLLTVPTLLGRTQQSDLIHTIIEDIIKGKINPNKTLENIQEEIITRMACRASVKAGDTLTIPRITELLKELSKCKLPYTCPHGRAIMVKVSADELEKKFLRK